MKIGLTGGIGSGKICGRSAAGSRARGRRRRRRRDRARGRRAGHARAGRGRRRSSAPRSSPRTARSTAPPWPRSCSRTPSAGTALEAIVHPLVGQRSGRAARGRAAGRGRRLRRPAARGVARDGPRPTGEYDVVVVVEAPEELRVDAPRGPRPARARTPRPGSPPRPPTSAERRATRRPRAGSPPGPRPRSRPALEAEQARRPDCRSATSPDEAGERRLREAPASRRAAASGRCRTLVVRWGHGPPCHRPAAHGRPVRGRSPTTARPATSRRPSPSSRAASRPGEKDVVLLGATGTGKSATTAWLIEQLQRPTLVMAPNKTLAAQLANEFRELLPNNAVEYFVSYYDYYQPEAYIPQTDTYIEKDSSINEEVERLRHSATNSLLTRRDVIVVAIGVVHLRPGHAAGVRRPDGAAAGRRGVRPRRPAAAARRRSSTPATTSPSPAARSGCAATRSRSSRCTRSTRCGSSSSATRSSALTTLHPLTGEVLTEDEELYVFPATHYVAGPGADGARDRRHRGRARGAARRAGAAGQAARGAAAAHAHHVRHRDDAPDRLLLRHRELLAAHRRPRRRARAPQLPARLLPRGLPARHRRVARHRAADRRHVRGRHVPQAHPRRARLPAARARWTTGRCGGRSSSSGSARPSTCRRRPGPTSCPASTATSSSRSSGRPAWSTPRSS